MIAMAKIIQIAPLFFMAVGSQANVEWRGISFQWLQQRSPQRGLGNLDGGTRLRTLGTYGALHLA